MSAQGLWTVQFTQTEEEYGGMQISEAMNRGGILVLMNNKIYGGNISAYFTGSYEETDTGISLTINGTRYNDIVAAGPFGVQDKARLLFKGRVKGDTMTLHGSLEQDPDKKLIIEAQRRSDLD